MEYNQFLEKLKEFELIKAEFDATVKATMTVVTRFLKECEYAIREGYIENIDYTVGTAIIRYSSYDNDWAEFHLPIRYLNASDEELKEFAFTVNKAVEDERIRWKKECEARSLREKEEQFERLRKELGK